MKKELESLIKRAAANSRSRTSYKPFIFDLKKQGDRKNLSRILKSKEVRTVVDNLAEEKQELAIVKKPKLMSHSFGVKLKKEKPNNEIVSRDGVWVYYPWQASLVHILDQKSYSILRMARNQNLITPGEQKKFAKIKIGIAGLNVGNPAAICLALEGGAIKMKFADNDTLSLSNLNRFRASIADLGLNKAVLSARQVYEINPFAKIGVWEKGISQERINEFLLKPRIDILIEEMDNLKLKILIRQEARKNKIPVLMVTGNGPNVIIDIERFDLDPKTPLLNSRLRKEVIEKIQTMDPEQTPFQKRVFLARDFIGAKYLTQRLRDSFPLVGRKLASIPQLAESSFLRGAALCYFVRQVAVGKKISSGRYYLNLDQIV